MRSCLKLKVLIVEDQELWASHLVGVVERKGHLASTAGTLAEATEMLARERFDVIVWDLNLPDGNTLGLIKTTRSKCTLTMFIAGSLESHNRDQQILAGCDIGGGIEILPALIEQTICEIELRQ